MTPPKVDTSAWVRCYNRRPEATRRLVCFPHAGGSAPFYLPMSRAMRSIEVHSVLYPGRLDRRTEPCIDNIPDLADQVYAALRPELTPGVALFGHSMGAVLAFEVARRMQADGTAPDVLFASGRRAPSRYRDEEIHRRDDAGILTEMTRLAGTDARILGDEELLRMILPAIRADYTAVETYRCPPGTTVDCPIEVLTGDTDPVTSADEAQDWAKHTSGPCAVHTFRGGHFFLADHAAEIIGLIERRLAG